MLPEKEFIKERLTQIPPEGCEFKVGDTVTFTNDYGVSFTGNKIIGFSKPDRDDSLYQRKQYIHLSEDAYWFPVRAEQLVLEADL